MKFILHISGIWQKKKKCKIGIVKLTIAAGNINNKHTLVGIADIWLW